MTNPIVRLRLRGKLYSRRRYGLILGLLWLYTLSWLAAMVWVPKYWGVAWYIRVAVMAVLVLATPGWRALFRTYDKFKAMCDEAVCEGGTAEQGTAPNGGPATPSSNSAVIEGPPSVS
jgi:hypothetical protein